MQVVVGNKKLDLNRASFEELLKKYSEVIVDLGTGDGRFVYQNALENPLTLYIGIDPSAKQLEIYSKKAQRRRLTNALFVVGSVEILPEELFGLVNKIYINLPWGSLLKTIILPTKESIQSLKRLIAKSGTIEITLGYESDFEPGEVERLRLPELNEKTLRNAISLFEQNGLKLQHFRRVEDKNLKTLNTTWAKKLTFGNSRPIYFVQLLK